MHATCTHHLGLQVTSSSHGQEPRLPLRALAASFPSGASAQRGASGAGHTQPQQPPSHAPQRACGSSGVHILGLSSKSGGDLLAQQRSRVVMLPQKGKALSVFCFPLPSPKSHEMKHRLLRDTPGSVRHLFLYAADGNGKLSGFKLRQRGVDGFFFHLHGND